jgi:hypothetical protein
MDKAIFQNEFAMVEVRRDESANGVRLLIRDLTTGSHIYLDPLELEALMRMDHSFFLPLVAPATREKTPMEAPTPICINESEGWIIGSRLFQATLPPRGTTSRGS